MLHSPSKGLLPGDLVIHHKVMFDAALVHRTGLVVGVRYERSGAHIGCEHRIDVCFSTDDQPFETMCDCELFNAAELP